MKEFIKGAVESIVLLRVAIIFIAAGIIAGIYMPAQGTPFIFLIATIVSARSLRIKKIESHFMGLIGAMMIMYLFIVIISPLIITAPAAIIILTLPIFLAIVVNLLYQNHIFEKEQQCL